MYRDKPEWREFLRKEKAKFTDDKWNFDKFKIQCNKCSSINVEINGHAELDWGYYDGDEEMVFDMLVKCHDCGNAMGIMNDNNEITFSNKN